MIISLPFEHEAIKSLKAELGISPDNAHLVEISLWSFGKGRRPEIACKVSVFTDDKSCVQGNGSNFKDARQEIIVALKPKSRILELQDEVKVITEE